MTTSIKTKINGEVSLDMAHGFDCIIRGQIVENFRSYEAARAYQRMHNERANREAAEARKESIKTGKKVVAPSLCIIRYYHG